MLLFSSYDVVDSTRQTSIVLDAHISVDEIYANTGMDKSDAVVLA